MTEFWDKKLQEEITKQFKFYEEEVLPKIHSIKEVTQKAYWYHWILTHTEWVVFRWIYFALSLWEDPTPVIFACAGHDLARTGDWEDYAHWPNAIPIVTKLMDMFDNLLTDNQKEMVKNAIKYHTGWEKAPDYVSACLRDADRCRLAREWEYYEKYFNTEPWKKVASWSIVEFLEFENKCLWRKALTDNEWVLRIENFIWEPPIE